MNIHELKNAIAIVNDQLTIDTNTLNSDNITWLLTSYVPNKILTINQAVITSKNTDDFVGVQGKCHLLAVELDVSARFFIINGNTELELKGTLTKEWHFSDSFASLEGNYYNDFTLHNIVFTFISKGNSTYERGLNFKADFQPPEFWQVLTWFANPGSSAILSGPITFYQGEPVMTLTVNPVIKASIGGYLNVDLTLQNLCKASPNPRNSAKPLIFTVSQLIGNISFTHNSKQVDIPISALFNTELSVLKFNISTAKILDFTWSEIAHWLGGINLGTQGLPDFYRPTTGLTLHNICFAIGLRTQILEYITVSVQSTERWRVIERIIELERIAIDFMVLKPTSTADIIVTVNARVNFAEIIELDVYAQVPDFQISGQLAEESSSSLSPLIEHQLGSAQKVADNLKIHTLSFKAYPGGNFYAFEIDVEGSWEIIPDLAIEEIGVGITYESYDEVPEISGAIHALFSIEEININIVSEYRGETGGWQFSGSTEQNQEIPIGIFINKLASKFGAIVLPSVIAELTLKNIEISFNTTTKNFVFACGAEFPIEGKTVDIIVTIDLKQKNEASNPSNPQESFYEAKFGGHITIGTQKFDLTFDKDNRSKTFVAAYSHQSNTAIPIKELLENVTSDQELLNLLGSLEIDLKNIIFAFTKNNTETKFLFGLDISTDINLSNLPLVGKEFPPNQTVGVDDLQIIVVASEKLSQQEVNTFNNILTQAGLAQLPIQPQGNGSTPAGTPVIKKGLYVAAQMKFGNTTETLTLPVTPKTDTSTTTTTLTTSDTPTLSPTDNTKWFTLQKTFGPVHFERVGIQYQDAALWFLLSAALSAAGLTLSLDGLSIGSPLSKFDPKFNLKGIGIDYRGSSALEIGGAFLKVGDNQYDGTAIIKTEKLTISAIGSYTELNGHPSLFIYATLDQPIGGPAFFFVTGLAAGFGYNRTLKLPTIEQVAQFPLVAEAINAQNPNITGLTSPPTPLLPGEGSQTPSFPASIGAQGGLGQPDIITQKLQTLKQYIPPATGEIFLAVGIKFTSFKMVDSFALLTLTFGNRFQLNLLGISTLIAPTPEAGKIVTPLAEVQLALKATFIPADGILQVQAQLTPASYLFSRNCHLTGGFAFYTWFGNNPHTGDFILTLGGYHPNYQVPAHYPQVPRLGFNWQVDEHLTLKGDAYYALTPSALMAGGHLQATWESVNLKAWFNAGADFLIAWKPYHYEAHIYVDLGASYTFELFGTHTITVDVGADLQIWGPEFSGKAQIHLWIISFDVTFGNSASPQPQPIGWNTFKASFLPHEKVEDEKAIPDKKVLGCSISVKDGLVRTVTQDKSEIWIINPKHFSLITNSIIPSKQAYRGSESQPLNIGDANTTFGIGSMDVKSNKLTSTHTITITKITKDGQTVKKDHKEDHFDYIPIYKNAPTGLWGESLTPDLNQNGFINKTLSGFEIRPKNQPEGGHTQAIDRNKLQYEPEPPNDAYKWLNFQPFTAETLDDNARRDKIKTSIEQNPARNNLLTALGFDNQEIEKIKLNPLLADEFLVAPQIGALAG